MEKHEILVEYSGIIKVNSTKEGTVMECVYINHNYLD